MKRYHIKIIFLFLFLSCNKNDNYVMESNSFNIYNFESDISFVKKSNLNCKYYFANDSVRKISFIDKTGLSPY